MWSFKKINPRRDKVRKDITAERLAKISRSINTELVISFLLLAGFVVINTSILSSDMIGSTGYPQIIPTLGIVTMISLGMVLYIGHYQKRISQKHMRALALVGLFVLLLFSSKMGTLLTGHSSWATGSAVVASIILSIIYDQRFALGMSCFYCVLGAFSVGQSFRPETFLIMLTGTVVCCFCLKEIRTRMKLLQVGALSAGVVFAMSTSLGFLGKENETVEILQNAGYHSLAVFLVGWLIQGLLPVIEKVFRVATSMTLLDYSDANQPLLKRLAMEAPGTYSHSLLVGSIAESAAEAIGRNGLLCRVGAYYHDIGKINKPTYFTENELGSNSRHSELSPTMSQLIIVGHVKDGIEMAKEYGLPIVLRQFIEAHHGTTLVEYFYNEAKKKANGKQAEPSESEFRYLGPKPRTKEAAIVMLSDACEGAVRSLNDVNPTRIESVVHNMSMKRLQDGQFDECDLTLRELAQIEASISKTLAAHYHGRIAYPTSPDEPLESQQIETEQSDPACESKQPEKKKTKVRVKKHQ
jgi:putative nucleotidyltransferase with HDIG domain